MGTEKSYFHGGKQKRNTQSTWTGNGLSSSPIIGGYHVCIGASKGQMEIFSLGGVYSPLPLLPWPHHIFSRFK